MLQNRHLKKSGSFLIDGLGRPINISRSMQQEPRRPGRPRDEDLATRRKEEILTVAAVFFAETGYRQADIQVLADRIGVGKGTVYRYFPTKEELFFATVDAGIQALSNCVNEAVEDEADVIEHIRKAISAYLGHFDRHPELVELLIIERAEFRDREQATYFAYKERNLERRLVFIQESINKGIIRNICPNRIINVISDTLYGVIFTNHFAKRKVPFEQQAQELVDILFHGILSDKHRIQENPSI